MSGARRQADQALAVPATPANAVDGPSGFDPSRIEEACRQLDAVMDEPIRDDWDAHVRRCVMVVAEALK